MQCKLTFLSTLTNVVCYAKQVAIKCDNFTSSITQDLDNVFHMPDSQN